MAEDFPRTIESQQSFKERSTESKFWIGQDFKTGHEIVVQPGQSFRDQLIVGPASIPPRDILKNPAAFPPGHSTRSVLARLGLEADPDWDKFADNYGWLKAQASREAYLPVTLKNYGNRAIKIETGEGVFRCFNREGINPLQGNVLAKYIEKAGMSISGVYGQDWFLVDATRQKISDFSQAENAELIALAINDDVRLWIPPDSDPVHFTNASQLEGLLKPVPSDVDPDFYISETSSSIVMGENPGLLWSYLVTPKVDERAGVNLRVQFQSRQIESQLVDPGFGNKVEGKPLALEILKSGEKIKSACVYLQLFEG